MSEQLQLRRGTASQVLAFTGAQGETVMDTTNNRLVVNDGATVGGFAAAKLAEVVTNTRVGVSDAAYTVLATDRIVAYTALTAARAIALIAAASFPTGSRLLIVDETGNCSVTKTLTLNAAGADTIDGAAAAVVNLPYGYIGLESNGSNAWTVVDHGLAPSLDTLCAGANGAMLQFQVSEILVSGMSGASVTASAAIPANSILFAVGMRVVTPITGTGGATSFEIGDLGQTGDSGNAANRFGSGLPFTAGSTNYGLIGPTAIYSACNVILTPNAGTFTAGAVRLSVFTGVLTPSAS